MPVNRVSPTCASDRTDLPAEGQQQADPHLDPAQPDRAPHGPLAGTLDRTAAPWPYPPMPGPIEPLHHACAVLGTRLFTLTTHDLTAGLFRRAYTSHPKEYPTHGTKPLERDAWYDLCITRAQPFVANTPADFAAVFFDHALITAMGLGSAANLPLIAEDGTVPGTVNLLAEPHHFTPDRLAAYTTLVADYRPALLRFVSAQIPHGVRPSPSPSVQKPMDDGV